MSLDQKKRSPVRKFVLITTVLVVIGLIAAIVLVRNNYYANLKPVNASQNSQLFTIEMGATAKEIGAALKSEGLVKESWAFEWYIRSNNLRDQLQAGSYYLSPSQGVEEIVSIITKGRSASELVTILPGRRIDQIKQSLVNAGFSPDEVEAALNPAVYAGHPALVDKPEAASLEGYIYPESFEKTPDTKAEVVIRAALDEMQTYLTPTVREGIVRQGLTVHQGVILASVIEKEVGVEKDRPIVAQVFLKRLREGIALESDATTAYGAVLNGDEPTETYASIYNTYQNKGLMPGPISNVSKSSLEAVANPAQTDFLFFVAGNDCITRFSQTNAEHEALKSAHGVGCL